MTKTVSRTTMTVCSDRREVIFKFGLHTRDVICCFVRTEGGEEFLEISGSSPICINPRAANTIRIPLKTG